METLTESSPNSDDQPPEPTGDELGHEMGPFALVPLWVLKRLVKIGHPEALALYVALHQWTAGHDRTCYPSRQTIAKVIGVSPRTVSAYAEHLEHVGAITREQRYADNGAPTSNNYTVRVIPNEATNARSPLAAGCNTPLQQAAPKPDPSTHTHDVSSSEKRFTRVELEQKANEIKRDARNHRRTCLDRKRITAMVERTPQPPIRVAACYVLGEDQPLLLWQAEHLDTVPEPSEHLDPGGEAPAWFEQYGPRREAPEKVPA